MLSAYITHPDCALHNMGDHHPECPERLGAINDHLLVKGLLDYMVPYDAPLATMEQLAHAHASLYVNEIIHASPAEGLHALDPDTNMCPHTLNAALRAAGAAVEATDLVLAGSAATAFCSVRPPGHHAERNAAMGFCFFNNVAVGIRHALHVHGLERVALIDFDVHHGNGTQAALEHDPSYLYISTHQAHIYPGTGHRDECGYVGNMLNIPLMANSGSADLHHVWEHEIEPALQQFAPQLILISAGFDAHYLDPLAELNFNEDDYAWITARILEVAQRHCAGRVVSMLEGGYNLAALASSVAAHVKELLEAQRKVQRSLVKDILERQKASKGAA